MSGAGFETQREAVPRVDTGEAGTALALLRFARHCVVKKTEGLDDERLRRAAVPSGTSLLGLVRHLTACETYWFGHVVGGAQAAADPDFSMTVPAEESPADLLAAYERACETSDALLARADWAAPAAVRVDGEALSVRWVVAHMTSETARHAGHADVVRELIDGVTGR